MLNYLWGFMIITGIIIGAFTGQMGAITTAAIDSSKDAVSLCITMLGIMSMWTGLMKIAEKSGLVTSLTKKMKPILKYLFPGVPLNHKASQYIATNFIANFLGLGWAATPAGLKAMKELHALNKQSPVASNAMCMFLIVNMSSVQLVSVNILAYRSQFGSVRPAEIIGPGILATVVSTFVAVVLGKWMERGKIK